MLIRYFIVLLLSFNLLSSSNNRTDKDHPLSSADYFDKDYHPNKVKTKEGPSQDKLQKSDLMFENNSSSTSTKKPDALDRVSPKGQMVDTTRPRQPKTLPFDKKPTQKKEEPSIHVQESNRPIKDEIMEPDDSVIVKTKSEIDGATPEVLIELPEDSVARVYFQERQEKKDCFNSLKTKRFAMDCPSPRKARIVSWATCQIGCK